MGYPDTAGYQGHSETSIEAAELLQGADTLRAGILEDISIWGGTGRTCDEVAQHFSTPNSTIGARLRELELKGLLIKTKVKRKTRYNRNAFVYVTPAYYAEHMGRAAVKADKPKDIMVLEAEHARMVKALDDIVLHCTSNFISPDQVVNMAQKGLGR